MLADAHEQAARELEADIQRLRTGAGSNRAVIELAWGAGFHWIAFGCQRQHNQHRENHQGLAAYLDGLNEALIADFWRDLERVRQGAFYGHKNDPQDVQRAYDLLQNIRNWATTP